jgi:hypothetical protein
MMPAVSLPHDSVYKGVHTACGARVALKVLPMSARHLPAVVNEIAAMRRVRHANVVRLVREEVIEVRLPRCAAAVAVVDIKNSRAARIFYATCLFTIATKQEL